MKCLRLLVFLALAAFLFACSDTAEKNRTETTVVKAPSESAAEKIDPETGLIADEGFTIVKKNCTICHSPQLITQNKASREGWLETIRWMQATQNLQQFDEHTEDIILTYLAKNYAPVKMGRRAPLRLGQWYRLNPND